MIASGGAEVFGYGAAFAAELARLGQLTPEQFAAQFPFPDNYLDHVSFDAARAKFFADFNADPDQVNATRLPEIDPLRLTDFRLSAEELTVFKKARVAKTLAAIREDEPKLDTCFDLFGEPRAVDFSQFRPPSRSSASC